MARNLSFSYSKMGMYKECPQKYKFRYVHMLPEQPKYYFAFGSALHSVMEFIYNPQTEKFPTLPQALTYFERVWDQTNFQQKGYASVEKELAGFAEGRRIIESYYVQNEATFVHPLSVELKSTLEVDGLSLISIVDRMDYLGDGLVKILDYKTGKTVQREPDQLYMYQKVVENSPVIKAVVQAKDPAVKQVRVGELSFYHLPTLKEMKFARASDKDIVSFWQGVLRVADSIRAGQFAPTPDENKCRWCDYRNLCPVFTGREYTPLSSSAASAPAATMPASAEKQAAEQPASEIDLLSEKIDRCGELMEQAAKLKQEILSLLLKNNFQQHFGKHYQAVVDCVKKLDFTDRAQVMNLLVRFNLLDKASVPTVRSIGNLLTDSTVPAAAKEQLEKLARRTDEIDVQIKKNNE